MSDRVFQRGIKELLDGEFIYHTTTAGLYFVNVKYMFNGERMCQC